MKQALKMIYLGIAITSIMVATSIFQAALASTPEEIREIFPDSIMAELVALNLGMEVADEVTDDELLEIQVLNLNDEAILGNITDLTGINRLNGVEYLYATNKD